MSEKNNNTNNNISSVDNNVDNVDYLAKEINNKEYTFQLKYKNIKFMKARFKLTQSVFAEFDGYIGEILYSALEPNIKAELSFSQFEDELQKLNLEDINEIAEELIKITFPKKFKQFEEEEKGKNGVTKKK